MDIGRMVHHGYGDRNRIGDPDKSVLWVDRNRQVVENISMRSCVLIYISGQVLLSPQKMMIINHSKKKEYN